MPFALNARQKAVAVFDFGALPTTFITKHLEARKSLTVEVGHTVAGVIEFKRRHTDHRFSAVRSKPLRKILPRRLAAVNPLTTGNQVVLLVSSGRG